ncbi:sirohydrochlorin chelatase [Streptomyces sp. NPDC059171]|uniref:sirohydrochlorin chelatase n=1 Tax=unclassified Streptomyces TaxID=2593676 RepID=UPI00368D30AC
MTEPAPEQPQQSPPLTDSTAHLLARITDQLGAQLSLVSRNGTRRPMHRTRHPDRPTEDGAASARPPAAPALVAVAHGSRDPQALRTVEALLDRVRELRPALDVRLGHIELNTPLLPDTLDGLRGAEAVLVPLLLGRGHHVKRDLPAATAAAPGVRTRIAAPLGPHPLLVEALYGRLVEAGWDSADRDGRHAGVVLAAAGSRDPDSAQDTRRTARLLSMRLGVPVVPAYASAATPTVPAALRALAARGRHRTFVASYFTAPGRFASACADAVPHRAAAPLGAHPAMARLVLHRYDQARTSPGGVRPARPDARALAAHLAA